MSFSVCRLLPISSKTVENSIIRKQRLKKSIFLLKNHERNAEKVFFCKETIDKTSKNDYLTFCRRATTRKIVFQLFVDD